MLHENAIEFYSEESIATVTFSKKKFINRIMKLKEKYPDKVEIVAEKGTLCTHIPVSWIKFTPPREFSDEQREAARLRFLSILK